MSGPRGAAGDTARDAASQPLEFAGISQKLYELGDLFLGLLDAGYILEGYIGAFLCYQAVTAAAETTQQPPSAGCPAFNPEYRAE